MLRSALRIARDVENLGRYGDTSVRRRCRFGGKVSGPAREGLRYESCNRVEIEWINGIVRHASVEDKKVMCVEREST